MKTVAPARTHTLALGGVESLTYRCIGKCLKIFLSKTEKLQFMILQINHSSEFLKSGPRTDIVGSQDGA